MKLPITMFAPAAALAALAACGPAQEQSVANHFNQVANDTQNAADRFESDAGNGVRASEQALDNQAAAFHNQADAVENRLDAVDIVPSNKAAARH